MKHPPLGAHSLHPTQPNNLRPEPVATHRALLRCIHHACSSIVPSMPGRSLLSTGRGQIGVMYGNPEVTSGGNALKFYASVRLEVRRKQTIEGAKGENVGIRVKAKVSTE